MSIGTAKPTIEEQDGVRHYFIDSHSVKESLSSGKYEKEALDVLSIVYKTHDYAILVGGSGMFINALLYGTDQIPQNSDIREELNQLYQKEGLEVLLSELKDKDIIYYNSVDQQNPVRIIRALEVIRITGRPFSAQRQGKIKQRPFDAKYFVIDHDREVLYERINKRVELMMDAGLLDEVKSLQRFKNEQPLNTVGYKELFDHLNGDYDIDRAVELIKRNTRRYAKRQLTWFRRDTNAVWIPFTNNVAMINQLEQHFNS